MKETNRVLVLKALFNNPDGLPSDLVALRSDLQRKPSQSALYSARRARMVIVKPGRPHPLWYLTEKGREFILPRTRSEVKLPRALDDYAMPGMPSWCHLILYPPKSVASPSRSNFVIRLYFEPLRIPEVAMALGQALFTLAIEGGKHLTRFHVFWEAPAAALMDKSGTRMVADVLFSSRGRKDAGNFFALVSKELQGAKRR